MPRSSPVRCPREWEEKAAKLAQKDVHARWTMKGGHISFGFKNSILTDAFFKLVRGYLCTDASCHDSLMIDELLARYGMPGQEVWADSAYHSQAREAWLVQKGYQSRINRRSLRNHPR